MQDRTGGLYKRIITTELGGGPVKEKRLRPNDLVFTKGMRRVRVCENERIRLEGVYPMQS